MLGTSRPRILIADDHALVADAFKKLLAPDFEIVATVYDGRKLIEVARKVTPDVIVADIGMPVLNGLEAAQRLKRILANVKVVYITVNHDPDLVNEAILKGASGYVSKTSAAWELSAAIYAALEGKVYISPIIPVDSGDRVREPLDHAPSELTDRQREVLQLLAEGRSMKEVGAELGLTTRTVAFHKYRIMQHLHLRNDAELVQYAIRHHVTFS
jgi:DNA-binding NarL/FixJ family response regulator